MKSPFISFIVICLLSLAVLGIFYGWMCWFMPNNPFISSDSTIMAQRGQFGDQFGALGALFTALSFAMLIYTSYIQNKSIQDQQNQISEQHTLELKQAEAIEKQAEHLRSAARHQEHSVYSQIAHMKIERLKALIETEKMQSLQWRPGMQQHNEIIARIRSLTDEMTQIIEDLEKNYKS